MSGDGADRPEGEQPAAPEDVAEVRADEGPGWLPAIMAATVLTAIAGLLFCAFSTWLLWSRRGEMAERTIRGSFTPQVEQSRLDPTTRAAVVDQLNELADGLKNQRYDANQAAGILQRLQRVPVLQWGQLQAVEDFYLEKADLSDEQRSTVLRDLSRVREGVRRGKLTSFDFYDMLEPVLVADAASDTGKSLADPLKVADAADVMERVRLNADRAKIPEEMFEDVRLEEIVADAISAGDASGPI